jgi:hypothetical protein
MNPGVQIAKILLEIQPVLQPRDPVHPGRGPRVQRPVGRPQAIDINVVQQRGEPCSLVLLCDTAHAVKRTWPVHSGSESGAGFADRVPLAQAPSLHRLRGRLGGVVRQLHRYYEPVRLLAPVHRGITRLSVPHATLRPLTCHPANHPGRGTITRQGQARDLPVLGMKRSHTCTGSPTTQGPLTTRDNAASDIAFRTYDRVGALDNGVFEAQ